ncbi:hypothetical protein LCGC14_2949450, partial [marine sediment metagenome]
LRQSAKMVEVFDGLTTTTEITAVAMNAAGSAAEEVALRLESAEVAVDRFKEGWVNLAKVIGAQFLEAVTSVVDGGIEIELALQKAVTDGSFDPIFKAFNNFNDELSRFLEDVAEALPKALGQVEFDAFIDSLGELGEEIKSLFGDLDLTDPDDLAIAIQFVVDSISSLITVTQGMVEAFDPIVQGIKNSIQAFNELDDESKEGTGNILASAKLVVDAGLLIGAAILTIGQHAETMERVFSGVSGAIQLIWNTLEEKIYSVLGLMFDAIEGLNAGLAAVSWGDLSETFEENAEWARKLKEEYYAFQDAAGADALEGTKKVWSAINDEIKNAADEVEKFKDIADAEAEFGLAISISDEVGELIDWAKDPEILKLIVT